MPWQLMMQMKREGELLDSSDEKTQSIREAKEREECEIRNTDAQHKQSTFVFD